MDERINDYNNYDKLVLYVRNKKADEIINYYNALGYELVSVKENSKYLDTKDLTFLRPHIIENKDRLQLLQIHLEVELNKMGKSEQHKHAFSINFTISLLTIGLFLLIFGGYQLLTSTTLAIKIVFSILGVIGIICLFLVLLFAPKIIKKENESFTKKTEEINNNIKTLLKIIKDARSE